MYYNSFETETGSPSLPLQGKIIGVKRKRVLKAGNPWWIPGLAISLPFHYYYLQVTLLIVAFHVKSNFVGSLSAQTSS